MKKTHQSSSGIAARYPRNAIIAVTLALSLASGAASAWTDPPTSVQAWQQQVNQLIRQKTLYPFQARLIKESGTTVVALVIGRNGDIQSLKVAQSSGNSTIDQAALDGAWRARQFPPFSPDMEGDAFTLEYPVVFRMNAEESLQTAPAAPSAPATQPKNAPATEGILDAMMKNAQQKATTAEQARNWTDTKTGLAMVVPRPLETRKPARTKRQYDALVNIVSTSGVPPLAGTSPALCTVGLMTGPIDMAESSPASALETTTIWARSLFGVTGKIESEARFVHQGVGGIELIVAPRIGPGHAYQRMYVAVQSYPQGRVVISCATHMDAMNVGLPLFRKVRDGVSWQVRENSLSE